jgi:hypothetical protein
MSDSLAVGMVQAFGNLNRIADRQFKRQRALPETGSERFTFHQLHDEELLLVVSADVVQHADVRVVEAGDGFGFPLEPFAKARILCDVKVEDLQGDGPPQTSVARSVNFTHAACPEQRGHLVRAETDTGRQGHE